MNNEANKNNLSKKVATYLRLRERNFDDFTVSVVELDCGTKYITDNVVDDYTGNVLVITLDMKDFFWLAPGSYKII